MKVILRFIMGLVAAGAVVVSASAIAKPPFTISPETTAITGPLRDDGSVDYVAALNERYEKGVTPDKNGFVLYLQATGIEKFPGSIRQQTISLLGAQGLRDNDPVWLSWTGTTPDDSGILEMWKAEDFRGYAGYLKREESSLALIERAAAMPQWWVPAVSLNGTFMLILLPHLNTMREVDIDLCDRALLRARQGDFDGFMADVIATKQLARRAVDYTIVSHLVAAMIEKRADQTIGVCVGAGIFNGDQCAKLARAIDALEPIPPLWQAMDGGERWSTLDCTQCIAMGKTELLASGSPSEDQWISRSKKIDSSSVDWDSVLREINSSKDEVVNILKTPALGDQQVARRLFDLKIGRIQAEQQGHSDLAREVGGTNQAYTQRVGDAILLALSPPAWKADDTCREAAMQGEMARAIVAAAQYRAEKGDWPGSLGELVPKYLSQAPMEMFSPTGSEPIRYQKTDAGICLQARGVHVMLSVGVDLGAGSPGL